MKKEYKFLGIEEVPFNKNTTMETQIIGVVVSGWNLEGVMTGKIKIDGDNATEEILRMVFNSKFKKQIKAIFLKGLSVGGFNIIDIDRLYKETKIPVIVCIKTMPNLDRIEAALVRIGKPEKMVLFRDIGKIVPWNDNNLYFQVAGIEIEKAKGFLTLCCIRSLYPEAIRIAKIIAQGMLPSKDLSNCVSEKKVKDPLTKLKTLIDQYDQKMINNNEPDRTTENLPREWTFLQVADWVAKQDEKIRPNIESIINIVHLNM